MKRTAQHSENLGLGQAGANDLEIANISRREF